jgi:hypothetical protein
MSLAATLPITAFAGTPWADRALSDEARIVRRLINAASEFSGFVAVGQAKRAAQEALAAAYPAARADGWDGAGSARVEPSTYVYADQFLRLLPSSASLPDITVDNDGEIIFEWDQGRRQVFSVSVGRDGTLTFAGLFGHTKIHGTEHLREALPSVISACLERLSASPGS